MKGSKNVLYILFLFLIAFGIALALQYNSYRQSKTLIEQNSILLEEMEYSNNIQFFQTHLLLLDLNLEDIVGRNDAILIEDLNRELKIIKLTVNYLHTYLIAHYYQKEANHFLTLINRKISTGYEVIRDIENLGHISDTNIQRLKEDENLNELINEQLIELEEKSESEVMKNTELINKAGVKSLKSSLYYLLLSCILFGLAMYYIFTRIRVQTKLINALHLAKEKEAKLIKIKEDFLANMSHEIRTPLNAILGFTDLLDKEIISENAKKFLQIIKSSGTQLSSIVNQILDLSKIEDGLLRLEEKPFSLSSVIQELEDTFRLPIESKGIKFVVVNQIDNSIRLLGDQYRLVQILTNLLANAIKFTDQGIIQFIATGEHISDQQLMVKFIIMDTGIGIEKGNLNRIFDRFEQADNNTTRIYGGSGLGLSIVKKLLDLQGGSIDVKSELNQGTTFTVSIPFKLENSVDSNYKEIKTTTPFQLPKDLKILLVEDNSINIQLIQHWFKNYELPISVTSNGQEAIGRIKEENFDLILMDIQMPVMDGHQCTQRLRQDYHFDGPIFGMTAHTMKQDMIKCYDSGMNAHIPKPIREEQLFQLIYDFSLIIQSELVNHAYLLELAKGNQTFLKDLLNEFLIQTPIELEKLKNAFYKDDLPLIQSTAHTLKTNFGYLGMNSAILSIIQKTEDLDSLPSDYNQFFLLDYLFARTKVKIQEELND